MRRDARVHRQVWRGRLPACRLLTRTTRSLSPTDAGERLLNTVGPRLDEVELELESLSDLRNKPNGTVRITSTDYATDQILWPKLQPFLRKYP